MGQAEGELESGTNCCFRLSPPTLPDWEEMENILRLLLRPIFAVGNGSKQHDDFS